jgi:predicted nuclease of predicted toxin-antitoxin system
MTIWLDAHISPSLAKWITDTLGVPATAVRELGLRDAKDLQIFRAARAANTIILTKDADFSHLLTQHGSPPKVIWLTCGNTSNENLRRILRAALKSAINLLDSGETIVEITGRQNGGR